MGKQAIILTPSKGFGELIRQVLADASDLQPAVLSSPAKVLEAAAQPLDLLVLDADFETLDFAAYLAELRQAAPGLHLLVIPAEDQPDDPRLLDLGADAVLGRPFYLPDLVSEIEKIYGPLQNIEVPKTARFGDAVEVKPTQPAVAAHPAPAWLADLSVAAQHLAQLSLESASQAALVTRRGEVWAYAGQLPQAAAQELAAALSQDSTEGDADLARFVHLDATKGDYMLYATALGDDYKLALVFDAQMPFSKMRAQVDKLASAMATAPAVVEAVPAEVEVRAEVRSAKANPVPAGNDTAPALPDGPSAPARPLRGTAALQPAASLGGDLRYAYVLIPRLPTHRLEGDLAEKLAAWLPQLCLAFAWRLEHLSIQPNFVQWMVSIPPDASPDSVAHTLDAHLSERIFAEFPTLQRDNPSGHFFAPGFFVSTSLPEADEVSDYIHQTRNRQGIPNQ